jgi:hypothetical protein
MLPIGRLQNKGEVTRREQADRSSMPTWQTHSFSSSPKHTPMSTPSDARMANQRRPGLIHHLCLSLRLFRSIVCEQPLQIGRPGHEIRIGPTARRRVQRCMWLLVLGRLLFHDRGRLRSQATKTRPVTAMPTYATARSETLDRKMTTTSDQYGLSRVLR